MNILSKKYYLDTFQHDYWDLINAGIFNYMVLTVVTTTPGMIVNVAVFVSRTNFIVTSFLMK